MEIALFWLVVYGVIWLLRLHPDSTVSRAAFTWLGPRPQPGELFSRYQWRWAVYSFGWLCQFALVFSFVMVLAGRFGGVGEWTWVGVLFFALPFGIGIATLAALGFAFKAAKARFFGPDLVYDLDARLMRSKMAIERTWSLPRFVGLLSAGPFHVDLRHHEL